MGVLKGRRVKSRPVITQHALEVWKEAPVVPKKGAFFGDQRKPWLPEWPVDAKKKPVAAMAKRRRRSNQPFDARDFVEIEVIAGNVVVASFRKKVVALKVFEKTKLVKRGVSAQALLFRERKTLVRLDHVFLCDMLFAFQTETRCFYGMPFYAGGSLSGLILEKGRASAAAARFYACEIAAGLGHLHSHAIVHRDLKPDNVLVAADGHVVVADFGSVADVGAVVRDAFVGTAQYAAPECLRPNHVITPAIDFWALGVLVFELVKNRRPFEATTLRSEWTKALGATKFDARTGHPHFDDALRRLLVADVQRRLATFGTFKDLPWVKDIDWNALLRKELKAPTHPSTKPPFLADDGLHVHPDFDLTGKPSLHRPEDDDDDDESHPDAFSANFAGFAVFSSSSSSSSSS